MGANYRRKLESRDKRRQCNSLNLAGQRAFVFSGTLTSVCSALRLEWRPESALEVRHFAVKRAARLVGRPVERAAGRLASLRPVKWTAPSAPNSHDWQHCKLT